MPDLAVFISYRRADTSADAGRLYDALRRRFGRDSLFMDVDSLRPGQDWVYAIESAVARCDVLLALIGRDWLNARDEHGRRRLDNELDPVRLEIEAAIRLEKPVIPVLFGDALMPIREELPPSLLPLVRRHAIRIEHASFDSDLPPLLRALRSISRAKPVAAVAPAAISAAKGTEGSSRVRSGGPQRTSPKGVAERRKVPAAPVVAGVLVAAIAVAVVGAFIAAGSFGPSASSASPPGATPTQILIANASLVTATPANSPTPTWIASSSPAGPYLATGTLVPPTTPPTSTPNAAKMTSPANFSGRTVTFVWSAATGQPAFWYGLYVGSLPPTEPCPAGQQCSEPDGWDAEASYDLALMPTGTQTSWQANGLPNDGSLVYVRLFTKFVDKDGAYIWRDYVYTAAGSG